MESVKPFVHLIETPYGKYLYDVNSDEIYGVSEAIYDSVKKLLNNQDNTIDPSSMNEIKLMKEKGLLKDTRPKVMKHPASDFMHYYLNHKLDSITLQITQNCNFRCEYCVYGQNTTLNRIHSKNSMTLDIAKSAINFLLNRSRDSETVNIGFYGGEPLLEFNLLKEIVLYAKDVFIGKHVGFNITTNCSLMNDEIIDFLNLHSIQILISLDGPKSIHDSKRIFAVNGCGTFDIIMRKLRMIKQKYPDYYNKSVNFNTVIDPSKEFDCINQMYINNDLLKDSLASMYNLIDDTYSIEKNKYSEEFIQQRSYEEFKIFLYSTGRINAENLSTISKQRIAQESEINKTLGKFKINEIMSHGGPCIIGKKTFIDFKGNLYPCERVSESSEIMRIGDLNKGFDLQKVNSLMNISELTESHCKQCWAIARCHMCARFGDNGSSLSADKILQGCSNAKCDFEYRLRRYIAIKEIKAGGNI